MIKEPKYLINSLIMFCMFIGIVVFYRDTKKYIKKLKRV